MFSVVTMEYTNNGSLVKIHFKSMMERDCWNFVRARLTASSYKMRDEMMVLNRLNEFCDPPEDVRAIMNYKKAINAA